MPLEHMMIYLAITSVASCHICCSHEKVVSFVNMKPTYIKKYFCIYQYVINMFRGLPLFFKGTQVELQSIESIKVNKMVATTLKD